MNRYPEVNHASLCRGSQKRVLYRLLAAVVTSVALAGCQTKAEPMVTAQAQPQTKAKPMVPAQAQPQKPPCELKQVRKGTAFIAEAWAIPDGRFNVGEPFRLQMRVSTQSYMSIFHVSTSCKVTRLMDNRAMPAATILEFPDKDSGLEITVKPPPGKEAFYFIASRKKIDVLAASDILRGGEIAALDLDPAQFFSRLRQVTGRINPADLAITTLRTTVVAH